MSDYKKKNDVPYIKYNILCGVFLRKQYRFKIKNKTYKRFHTISSIFFKYEKKIDMVTPLNIKIIHNIKLINEN